MCRTISSSNSPSRARICRDPQLEALAIDAYRVNRMTSHPLYQLLEIPSRSELDGFLKHHGVPLEYSFGDFEREGTSSARLWQKRQDELAAERDR